MGRKIPGFLWALVLVIFLISPSEAAEPQIEIYHLFVNLVDDSTIEVQEQVVFQQTPPTDITLTFTLPDGAHTIRGSQGEAQLDGNKLQISGLPAEADFAAFSYLIPLEGPHAVINKTIDYDTPGFYVIFPQGDLKISGGELQDGGIQAMGDKEYSLMLRENLSAGSIINMAVVRNYEDASTANSSVFSRVPLPDFHSPGHIRFWRQSPFAGMDAHLFLVLIIVIPIMAVIFYIRGRKRDEQKAKELGQSEEDIFLKLAAREKVLKQKLKEVELQYQQGQVTEESYTVKREVYKKKLIEVRMKLRKFTG